MNTRKGKVKFKKFHILLDSGCSSTIVMGRLVKNRLENDTMMQWNTLALNIPNNIKVNIYFTLPALSATHFSTCKIHVDASAKGRYYMVLGQDIIIELGLNLKFSEHVIEEDDGPFNGSTTSMVDLGNSIFKDLNTGEIIPEE